MKRIIKLWGDSHPANTVPAGIYPLTGQKPSDLDRTIIADSAMSETVQTTLRNGLRNLVVEHQVVFILDKYTIGEVGDTARSCPI